MRKPVMFLVGVLVAAVGWILFNNNSGSVDPLTSSGARTTAESGSAGQSISGVIEQMTSKVKGFLRTDNSPSNGGSAVDLAGGRVIRVATFNIDAFNETKARKPKIVDILARVCRQFDVIAVQEIQSQTDDLIPRLVDLMNKTGLAYDYAIGPRLGPIGAQQQYAFIFNQQTVVIDRSELYTVDDQDDLMVHEPFVGWFRTVAPDAASAFTFSVINVGIDPASQERELNVLDDVLFAVSDDGREEDDIILAGDFRRGARQLGEIDRVPDLVYAVSDVPTNAEGTETWSNIVIRKTSTIEFNGRGGVFDFLREYNLTLDEALEVSDHLPVWAEFSIYEGGQPGRVANRGTPVENSQ